MRAKGKLPKTSHPVKAKKGSVWQVFTYKIEAFNQRAGTATARLERDKRGRPTTVYAQSETTGAVKKAFPMDHRQVSHLRKGKSYPSKTIQHRDDPFGKMGLKMLFPRKANRPTVVDRHKDGKERTRKRKLPHAVNDPLSALLNIATRETKLNDSWELPMFSGVKLYGVQAKTIAKEEIWTPAMGMHPAYKIEVVVYREPKWKKVGRNGFKITGPAKDGWNRKITLWISAEKPGMVLRAVYQMKPLGEVQVVLENYRVEKATSGKKAGKKG